MTLGFLGALTRRSLVTLCNDTGVMHVAAAVGARWILVSRQARLRAKQIAGRAHYNELTTYPKFNRKFALGMLFPDPNSHLQA